MSGEITVTIAICTWNRAGLLRQTLDCLTAMDWSVRAAASVLVVDNASTDDTRAVAESFSNRLPIRLVTEPLAGLSNARNRAIDTATSSHVLFTDDDVLVYPEWLAAFVDAIQTFPEAAVFGGVIEPWFQEDPDRDVMEAFPALRWGFCGLDHRRGTGILPAPLDLYGANIGFRTEVLRNNRFDPRLGVAPGRAAMGEETQIVDRLRAAGEQVVWVPDMRVKHYVDPARTQVSYLTRYYRGLAEYEVLRNGPPAGPTFAGIPRWVIRQVCEQRVRSLGYRLLGRRVDALTSLRLFNYYRGVAKQSYRLARTHQVRR